MPTLRALRELEPASDQPAGGAEWGFRHGVLSVGVLFALALATAGGYFAWREPERPEPFDPVLHMRAVEVSMDQLTTQKAFALWITSYEPLARSGFGMLTHPNEQQILREIDRCRTARDRLFAAAAIVLVGSAVAAPLLPR